MAEMSWVFMTGTGSQLVAVAIVLWELIRCVDGVCGPRTLQRACPDSML
jgi:hypothetical protein